MSVECVQCGRQLEDNGQPPFCDGACHEMYAMANAMTNEDFIIMAHMMSSGTARLLEKSVKTATTRQIAEAARLCPEHHKRLLAVLGGCLDQVHDLVAIDEASRASQGGFSVGGEVRAATVH